MADQGPFIIHCEQHSGEYHPMQCWAPEEAIHELHVLELTQTYINN